MKASFLSICHMSPLPLTVVVIISDLAFMVCEFCLSDYAKLFKKSWLTANISVNIALTVLVFGPTAIIELIITSIFIILVFVCEGYIHFIEATKQSGELVHHTNE